MVMHSKNTKSEYTIAVLKVKAAKTVNVVFCAIGIALAAAVNVFTYSTAYKFTALCLSAALVVFLASLLYKNAREMTATTEIAKKGAYACRMTKKQHDDIARQQIRVGRQFNMSAFLVVFTVEAVILVVMYMLLESRVFLLFMAVFTLACFAVTVLANLYLSARLYEKKEYCTLYENGILVGGEVIRFKASEGDVKELFVFDDYFFIKYKRRALFGVSYTSEIIVPTTGAYKDTTKKNATAALCDILKVARAVEIPSPYFEARDYYAETGSHVFKQSAKTDAINETATV